MTANATLVVVRGYWRDADYGSGIDETITFTPMPLSGSRAPNVRDLTEYAWLRTKPVEVTPDPDNGFWAVRLLANNDPDLDGFAGWQVRLGQEEPFTIEVPYNATVVTADAALAEALPEIAVGDTLPAMWLVEAAVISNPPPQPPAAYLTQSQTLSAIASAIAAYGGGG